MQEKFYDLNERQSFVIYGGNAYCQTVAKSLVQKGYSLDFFIDRNASKLIMNNEIVITLEKLEKDKELYVNKNSIVFIALQNAIEHEKIACEIFKIGYKKIIYLPITTKNHYVGAMREVYNKILHSELENINKIPFYCTLIEREDYWTYKEYSAFITVQLPISMLRSDDEYSKVQQSEHIDSKFRVLKKYSDVPLQFMHHYLGFFKYLKNQRANITEYIQFQETDFKKEKEIIVDRSNLITLFDFEFEKGLDFFVESAPYACWNKKGYFNLKDGHHRSLYLVSKGKKTIPVKIKRDCYENLLTRFGRESITTNYLMVDHPNYYQEVASYDSLEILLGVIEYFENINSNSRILDMTKRDLYFYQTLRKMDFESLYCTYEYKETKYSELLKFYNIQYVNAIQENSFNESDYDYILCEELEFKNFCLKQEGLVCSTYLVLAHTELESLNVYLINYTVMKLKAGIINGCNVNLLLIKKKG